MLRPERIDRALHTAAVFASFCRASDIDQVEAVATSAIRDAANSDELLDAIREQHGSRPARDQRRARRPATAGWR